MASPVKVWGLKVNASGPTLMVPLVPPLIAAAVLPTPIPVPLAFNVLLPPNV